jgi:exopolyphosphatase/guanosine-5'-triphosphate,3'-diphosphate pyrophosphatase
VVGLHLQADVMRVAAIDVGTNTVLGLVADVRADGRLDVLADEERFARLGEGVDASGRLTDAAMARALASLAATKATAGRLSADRIAIGATSASRDARNVGTLAARVRAELGLGYRVLTGDEEALLTFQGALTMVPDVAEACVLDVGGGSTEVVVGAKSQAPRFRVSLDVGSVRLTERFFTLLPPEAAAVREAEEAVDEALAAVPEEVARGLPLVEGGGMARVLAALAGMPGDAPAIPLAAVRAWRDRLLALPPDAVRALAPRLLTGREDVTGTALLILERAMRRFGAGAFVASPGGLRHGLALEAALGGA